MAQHAGGLGVVRLGGRLDGFIERARGRGERAADAHDPVREGVIRARPRRGVVLAGAHRGAVDGLALEKVDQTGTDVTYREPEPLYDPPP